MLCPGCQSSSVVSCPYSLISGKSESAVACQRRGMAAGAAEECARTEVAMAHSGREDAGDEWRRRG